MTDPRDRMRALERLREVENQISLRVHVLRRWVQADLKDAWRALGFEGAPPEFGAADRIEYWWKAPGPGGEPKIDRETFDRIEILAEWLAAFDSAVADQALAKRSGVSPYFPGEGDGTPLAPILEKLFLDLWSAQQLREEAGVKE